MGNTWSKKWKQLLIWFSGYFSFTAFAIIGGYTIIKGEDECKQTAKQTFIVTLIFAALSAFTSLFYQFMGLADYNSGAYKFYEVCNHLIAISKIIVYAVFMIMAFVKKEEPKTEEKQDEEQQ